MSEQEREGEGERERGGERERWREREMERGRGRVSEKVCVNVPYSVISVFSVWDKKIHG